MNTKKCYPNVKTERDMWKVRRVIMWGSYCDIYVRKFQ